MATEVSHKSYGPLVPYTYFGNGTASSAIGMDGLDGNKLKISALAAPNVNPTTVNQISIDPAANGNIVLNPNGSGTVNIDYATQYKVAIYGASGALSEVASVGSAAQVLTSNGAGANPTFQAIPAPTGTAYRTAVYSAGGTLSEVAALGSSGQVLTSNGAGALPTYQSLPAMPSGGYTWNRITGASQTPATKNGYITDSGTLTTYTVPGTGTLGDSFIVTSFGNGSSSWRLAQSAGVQIFFGNQSTTGGVTGYLQSTGNNDVVELVYVKDSEGAQWQVIRSIGNITVV